MSRASRRDNTTSTSLFPFLAVLLCTMGVLVVLLVIMASVQLSQARNKQLAKAKLHTEYDSDEQKTLRAELAAIEKRQRRLERIRDDAAKRLHNEEQRLSQIEENIRRRQERLELLRVEIEELKALIEEKGGKVHKTEYWGLRTLAYRMNKNRKGHYGYLDMEAGQDVLDALDYRQRFADDVMRYMTCRVDELTEEPSAVLRKSEDRKRRDRR